MSSRVCFVSMSMTGWREDCLCMCLCMCAYTENKREILCFLLLQPSTAATQKLSIKKTASFITSQKQSQRFVRRLRTNRKAPDAQCSEKANRMLISKDEAVNKSSLLNDHFVPYVLLVMFYLPQL